MALAQAEKVKEMLIKKYDELRSVENFYEIEGFDKKNPLEIELKVIVTKGDKDLRDFTKIKGITQKDLFVKEIEKEMLEKKIDLAVHSLKDMPQNTPEGLLNACFPMREDNRDVLVCVVLELLNIARGELACRDECARILEICDAASLHSLDDLDIELLLALDKALQMLPLAAVLIFNFLCGLERFVNFLLEILHALFCHCGTSPESSQKAVIC